MVNGFFIKVVLKIKLIKIMMVCIIFGVSIIFSYQPKASANSFADIPGFADEMFETLMKGAFVVAGGAAHAQDTINSNLETVSSTARGLWNTYSPQAKQAFMDSLTIGADGIVVAGNYITDFFNSLASSNVIEMPTGNIDTSKLTYTTDPSQIFFGGVSSATVTLNGVKKEVKAMGIGIQNERVGTIYLSTHAITVTVSPEKAQSYLNSILGSGMSFSQIISAYRAAGATVVLNNNGVPVPVEGADSKFNQWLENTVKPSNSLGLSVPRSMPYANTGQPLSLGLDGLYLPDGKLYDGPINWQLEGALTDAGTLVIPDIMINGVPHKLVHTPNGYVAVNPTTGVPMSLQDASAAGGTVIPNQLVYIDGVPYFKTGDNTLINVLTGEVVGNPPIDTEVPTTGDVTGLWAKLWEWLKSILDVLKNILAAIVSLPVKLLDLLKALLLALFIPSEGFWSSNLDALKALLWGEQIGEFTDGLSSLGSASGGTFKDVVVSLMGVNSLTVIDADSVNAVLNYIHKWVRGVFYPFLLIYNINMLYKLIRGTSLVEMTRLSRNKAGD